MPWIHPQHLSETGNHYR